MPTEGNGGIIPDTLIKAVIETENTHLPGLHIVKH